MIRRLEHLLFVYKTIVAQIDHAREGYVVEPVQAVIYKYFNIVRNVSGKSKSAF